MANLNLNIKPLETTEYIINGDDEHWNSMTTNFDVKDLKEVETELYNVSTKDVLQSSTHVMLMNSYFQFVYAKAIINVKHKVVKQKCYGCFIDHPSQSEHDCIMTDLINDDEHAYEFYFEEMLEEVDETKVLLAWEDLVQGLSIPLECITFHKQVISSKDYLAVMKTNEWKKKMKKTIQTILHAEHRLFSE